RYDPANSGAASRRPSTRTNLETAGTAPGSIIAAIIDTHTATKNANEPSSVATPMSIPFIWRRATSQDAAASASVAVSSAVVAAVSALIIAAARAAARSSRAPTLCSVIVSLLPLVSRARLAKVGGFARGGLREAVQESPELVGQEPEERGGCAGADRSDA